MGVHDQNEYAVPCLQPHVSFVSSVFVLLLRFLLLLVPRVTLFLFSTSAGYVDPMPGRGATVNVVVIWSMWQAECGASLYRRGRVGVVAARCGRFWGCGFIVLCGVYLPTGFGGVG
ncbi:hypothetical protein BJ912DRAFT_1004433 [Pholiota molesta]|nr:hypothetical protein BJ912DRAFT_1004433 [Pholiota molesta]